MLQAVAVMLMVWLHLFGFPERIDVPYVLVIDTLLSGKLPLEQYLAYFGSICIAVFAFSSGFGMRKKTLNSEPVGILKNYIRVFQQILKFYSRYWAVFFVFIPLGFLLKVYPLELFRFIKGVLGAGGGYNEEWWYVTSYVQVLLLFPLLAVLFDLLSKYIPVLTHILMVALFGILMTLPEDFFRSGLVKVLTSFTVGMYFAENRIFDMVYRLLPQKAWLRLGIGIALFGAVFVLRFCGIPDCILVAVFVFSVMVILKTEFISRFIHPVLMFIGKYSTYIWLTHTFFGYYFFQKLTFFPRYSWLVFLWCMILSVASGIVLEGLLELISKGAKKIRKGICL